MQIQENPQIRYRRDCEQCVLHEEQFDFVVHESSQFKANDDSWNEDDLIQPCLCNQIAHRECIKRKIIKLRQTECPNCCVKFQALETKQIFAYSLNRKTNKIIMKILLSILGTVIIALALLYLSQIQTYQLYDYILQLLSFGFGIISCVMMIAYIVLIIANGFIRSKIPDIQILCYQTETRKHSDKQIVKQFLERLNYSGILK